MTSLDGLYNGEQWRAVVGMEGLYEVSDLGRIRALPDRSYATGPLANKWKVGVLSVTAVRRRDRLSVPVTMKVTLTDGRKRYLRQLDMIVARAFLPPPLGIRCPRLLHLNGDPEDCRAVNLRWVRHGETMRRAYLRNLPDTRRGEENHSAKLSPQVVAEMRRRAGANVPLITLAAEAGVSYATARSAVRGITWAHVTDPAPVPAGVPGRAPVAPKV